jgi:hypothetical protein
LNVKYVRLSEGCANAADAAKARMAAAQPSRLVNLCDMACLPGYLS